MNRTQQVQPLHLSTLTTQQRVIHRAAGKGIPRLADFCLIHVATPRCLRCVTAMHRGSHHSRDMLALMSSRPIRRDDLTSTVAGVVRSGKPVLRPTIRQEDIDRASRGAMTRVYSRLAPRSALVVPLIADGAVLGTLSLCYSQSGRSHAPHHVPQAERLAARVSAALIGAVHAASRLLTATRHAGKRAAVRRRKAARN